MSAPHPDRGADGAGAPRTPLRRAWAHVHGLWPGYQLLAVSPFFLWPLYCLVVLRQMRWEMVFIFVASAPLSFTNRWSRRLMAAIMPFGFTGLSYELMRPLKNVGLTVDNVHVCDLRNYELALFGFGEGASRITLQDYFLAHHAALADLYFAIPYGLFIFIPASYAVYLYFRDYVATLRYMWTFFALNLVGFLTYHLYPAAPPWYFHQYGCHVDLATHASEAVALMRVDQLLGIDWFKGLYGRSSDVFGAIPSLHVAYVSLIVVEGWRLHRWLGRALTLLLAVSTAAAAVYLDHHWVIDVVLGVAYTLAVHPVIRHLFRNVVDDSRLTTENQSS
jgi:membrane-associated phospholipid phosphatase